MSLVTWFAEHGDRRALREASARVALRPAHMPRPLSPELAAEAKVLAAERARLAPFDDPHVSDEAATVDHMLRVQDQLHRRALDRLELWIIVLSALLTITSVALVWTFFWCWR